MGKTPINAALGELHGKVDDYVFRVVDGETVVARRPRPSTVPPTAAQLAQHQVFREAGNYAKAVLGDPLRLQPYLEFVDQRKLPRGRVPRLITTDYLKPPAIVSTDLANYHRQAGGEIRIIAKDDVAVAGVTVKITRQADGTVIEQGAATYYGPYWRYAATAAAPAAPEPLAIQVAATDLPGHVATDQVQLMT